MAWKSYNKTTIFLIAAIIIFGGVVALQLSGTITLPQLPTGAVTDDSIDIVIEEPDMQPEDTQGSEEEPDMQAEDTNDDAQEPDALDDMNETQDDTMMNESIEAAEPKVSGKKGLPDLPVVVPVDPNATMENMIDESNITLEAQDPPNITFAAPELYELYNGDTFTLSVDEIESMEGINMVAYNNMIPGPALVIEQGSRISFSLTNNLNVDTNIHWHGIRGSPATLAAGSNEETTDTVTFLDPGIYWYHSTVQPHMQRELGLSGPILVRPETTEFYNPVNIEKILILDDVLAGGRFEDHYTLGRYGDTMLINGDPDYEMTVSNGDVVRLYLINAANARVINFSIEDEKIKLVGGDQGKYEQETYHDSLLIAPGERYIIEVLLDSERDYKMLHATPETIYILGTIHIEGQTELNFAQTFNSLGFNLDVIEALDPLRTYFNKPVDFEIYLRSNDELQATDSPIIWEESEMEAIEDIEWSIVTDENEAVAITTSQGLVKLRVVNDEPVHQVLHLQGHRFLIVEMDGEENENLVWKDTVLITKDATYDLLIDASNIGDWVLHSQNAEYLAQGMIANFRVV